MEHDERIPGVTFRLHRADKRPPIDPGHHRAIGQVELTAEINDFEVWEDVLNRLNGMRVYTVENLAEEMISVVQDRAKEAERTLASKNEVLHAELEKVKQALSFAEAELDQARKFSAAQQVEITRLRAFEQELEELSEAVRAFNHEQMLRDKGELR